MDDASSWKKLETECRWKYSPLAQLESRKQNCSTAKLMFGTVRVVINLYVDVWEDSELCLSLVMCENPFMKWQLNPCWSFGVNLLSLSVCLSASWWDADYQRQHFVVIEEKLRLPMNIIYKTNNKIVTSVINWFETYVNYIWEGDLYPLWISTLPHGENCFHKALYIPCWQYWCKLFIHVHIKLNQFPVEDIFPAKHLFEILMDIFIHHDGMTT